MKAFCNLLDCVAIIAGICAGITFLTGLYGLFFDGCSLHDVLFYLCVSSVAGAISTAGSALSTKLRWLMVLGCDPRVKFG